jgi:hypothetical protein
MELSTKVSGKIIKLMVKVFSGMFMVTSTKAIGREIKPMDMVNTLTATEQPTRVIGETIFSTDEV